MEKLVNSSQARLTELEKEKSSLQADVEVKKEVVQESSEQIKSMRHTMEKSEEELEAMKTKLENI